MSGHDFIERLLQPADPVAARLGSGGLVRPDPVSAVRLTGVVVHVSDTGCVVVACQPYDKGGGHLDRRAGRAVAVAAKLGHVGAGSDRH